MSRSSEANPALPNQTRTQLPTDSGNSHNYRAQSYGVTCENRRLRDNINSFRHRNSQRQNGESSSRQNAITETGAIITENNGTRTNDAVGDKTGRNRRRFNNFRQPKRAQDRKDHAGVRMTGHIIDCLICCQRSDLYAVGDCLHPMCMECAIRARILGKSNLCPHCRTQIGTLYFVESKRSRDYTIPKETVPFRDEAKFGVKFETDYALACFNSYLAHKCQICCARDNSLDAFVFPNFAALQQHMTQMHQLTFCYLCTENLNTLTKDRRTYTREQLQRHMNGDERGAQKTDGFKGHPKCLFCEQRFYDDEQQYRHLRKDHFYCQICDSDGADNFFYKTHNELTKHYKRAHFPCTHPDCLPLGIVYRTNMELNVHSAKKHSQGRKHMQIDFPIGATSSSGQGTLSSVTIIPATTSQPSASIYTIVPSAQTAQRPVHIVPSASGFNALSGNTADFPRLYQNLQTPYGAPPNWRQTQEQSLKKTGVNASVASPRLSLQSGEQFPGLPGNAPASASSSKSSSNATATANSVWAKGTARELFTNQLVKQLPLTTSQQQQAESGKSKRKKLIPLPDVFPEGMRDVLRARQMGLPEPTIDPIAPSHADRFEEMKRQEKAQKKKEKKSKRVSAVVVTQKIADSEVVPVVSTRFGTLCDESSEEEKDEFGRPKNWWSGTKSAAPTLRESTDDFVRIDLGTQVSHRRARPEAESESSKDAEDTNLTAKKFPISLSSIAANLDNNFNETTTEKDAPNEEEEKKIPTSNDDELELLRHQHQAHYQNDYNLENEDLDMQMALEMSLLSSKLFLPPSIASSSLTGKSKEIKSGEHSNFKEDNENPSRAEGSVKEIHDKNGSQVIKGTGPPPGFTPH